MAEEEYSSERGGGADAPLAIIRDIHRISGVSRFPGFFKKDCVDLVRRISLLTHFLEEIRDLGRNPRIGEVGSSSPHRSCFADLTLALHDVRRLLFAASSNFDGANDSSVMIHKRIDIQFRSVTIALEKALMNFPHHDFEVSEDVQDQVALVKSQLRRAVERYHGSESSLVQPSDNETDPSLISNRAVGSFDFESKGIIEVRPRADAPVEIKDSENIASDEGIDGKDSLSNSSMSNEINTLENSHKVLVENATTKTEEEIKNLGSSQHSLVIPADFLCPISLELMKDPVIVATGQTYERSCIQKWIDCGNKTCPKTRQKLWHLTLTPNYLLRRLISQWSAMNNVHQPTAIIDGKIRQSDGLYRDINGNVAAIRVLVHMLSSGSMEDLRTAVAEIRSLTKRSTDNRILLAEAGAIPILVTLLSSKDARIQDNAITCILNLSIYENNKELIVLSDAIPLIVGVLSSGTMEARENAAATLFSLSNIEENKIVIGASGAILALVDLLQSGSPRGKKDAATALYSLCAYPRNKGRAIKAGIIAQLHNMLTDSTNSFVDEALTILSVLVSYHGAKLAMVKADMIPSLIALLSAGSPSNQENASAILLSLCKKSIGSLVNARSLGVVTPLLELTKNGTERARRKALELLEFLANTGH